MSINFSIKWGLIGLSVGALIGLADHLSGRLPTPTHTPQKLGIVNSAAGRPAGKSNQSLIVEIHNLNAVSDSTPQDIELEIRVRSTHRLSTNVVLEWKIPAGVTLLNGKGSVQSITLNPGQVWTESVRVRGLSTQQNQILRLDARGTINAQPVAAQGVFSTQPLQPDLVRRRLGAEKAPSYFSKTLANPVSSDGKSKRWPAGIQF